MLSNSSVILKQGSLMARSLTFCAQNTFATKMQASSTSNNKDSAGRRLGVKKFGGEEAYPNDILVRQRGFKWHPGKNTYWGKDHTIHSKTEGIVRFEKDPFRKRKLHYVHVDAQELRNRHNRPPPPYCYHPELFPDLAAKNPEPAKLKVPVPRPARIKDKSSFGQVVEQIKHRVSVNVPDHYAAGGLNRVSIDQNEQIATKMRHLEQNYLGRRIVENGSSIIDVESNETPSSARAE